MTGLHSFRTLAGAIVLAAGIAQPGTAAIFGYGNDYSARQVSDAVFEITLRVGARNPGAMWCGAATYARNVLRAPWRSEIYVFRGRKSGSVTVSGAGPVQFTLDAAGTGITPIGEQVLLNAFKVGQHMSVQRANLQCHYIPDP